MKRATLYATLALFALFATATAQKAKPVLMRPRNKRKYTTALSVDGGALAGIISTIICEEIEASIKRYILNNTDLIPRNLRGDINSADDFHILLADFFDAMGGVSAGSWMTGYLASKGGNGAASVAFEDRRIVRRYGNILPGESKGMEVFFLEYGDTFYPGGVLFNITPPTVMIPPGQVPNLTDFVSMPQAIPAFLPGIEIPGVNAAFFPVEGLEAALDVFVGNATLSELTPFYVLHAYDLIRRQNLYFVHDDISGRRSVTFTAHPVSRNAPRAIDQFVNEDGEYIPDVNIEAGQDFYLRDLLRGSSALPAFHKAKVLTPVDDPDETFVLTDGSTVTNNPALQLLIFLTTSPRLVPTADVAMISIGSGVVFQNIADNVDSAPLGWLINGELLNVMAAGSAENVQSQVEFLFYGTPGVLPGQYLRVQVVAEANTTEGVLLTQRTEYDNLPGFRRMGVAAAKRYRPAIDYFVENFIFA